ncbi:R3H domain-containing nucleic acid-binding protein [Agrococcus sp. Marseille-Q4369]|uniref:Jag family protein n=1 Tax=Agrococcus sp. Marseille-Q4369 TaxID=2810513 RepID=UPI001B8CD19B|nr:R3H domain-containing nucleic acid-binding protein [Agrococcus sp. Marseille-Q4369]QUW17987.1 DNA-binding protein [Agrococcus sp. Marseille-Q4369]
MTEEQSTTGVDETIDEGEIAADYIEGLLDIADFDGDIEIEQTDARTTIKVGEAGDDLGGLAEPTVVAALQDLTRLAVQQQSGEFSRLVLDVAGSRDARALALQSVVDEAAAALAAGAPRVALEPMSSYERKLVHDLVREHGLESESEGEGAERHIVIIPA